MSMGALFGVVTMQVLVFQFAAVRLARVLPDYLVGYAGLPAAAHAGIDEYRRTSGRLRYALGAVLVGVAVLATWILPLPHAAAKLTLAAVSLISGGACAAGYVHDRIRLAAIAGRLPEPEVRSADLRSPGLGLHYNPAWEVVPLLILAGTVVATAWTMRGGPADGAGFAPLVVLPAIQGLYVLGALAYSWWNARAGSRLSQSAKAFMGGPARAVEVEETLKRLELRFLMASKIMVASLLASMQAERLLGYRGAGVPALVDLSSWALVLLLLVLFLLFMIRASAVRRTIES